MIVESSKVHLTSEKRGIFHEGEGGGLSPQELCSFQFGDKVEGNVLSRGPGQHLGEAPVCEATAAAEQGE